MFPGGACLAEPKPYEGAASVEDGQTPETEIPSAKRHPSLGLSGLRSCRLAFFLLNTSPMSNKDELWLSVDLSAQAGSLSLHRSRAGALTLLAELDLEDGGKHSESVLPAVAAVLSQASIAFDQVDRFITSSGPGSFTGLRIAFSALKAFAQASGKPFETVDGHEARALHWLERNPAPSRIAAVTAITRDSLLWTEFVPDANGVLVEREELLPAEPEVNFPVARAPLKARHLAEALNQAKSRTRLKTTDGIAAASPRYFGARWEKSSSAK